jgi:hypothetical protein
MRSRPGPELGARVRVGSRTGGQATEQLHLQLTFTYATSASRLRRISRSVNGAVRIDPGIGQFVATLMRRSSREVVVSRTLTLGGPLAVLLTWSRCASSGSGGGGSGRGTGEHSAMSCGSSWGLSSRSSSARSSSVSGTPGDGTPPHAVASAPHDGGGRRATRRSPLHPPEDDSARRCPSRALRSHDPRLRAGPRNGGAPASPPEAPLDQTNRPTACATGSGRPHGVPTGVSGEARPCQDRRLPTRLIRRRSLQLPDGEASDMDAKLVQSGHVSVVLELNLVYPINEPPGAAYGERDSVRVRDCGRWLGRQHSACTNWSPWNRTPPPAKNGR